jgi:hypothetical protein
MAEPSKLIPKLLTPPFRCALWKQPELIGDELNERFESLETLVDDESPLGNVERRVLRCRECGQLYLLELYFRSGASYQTFIPVQTREIAECLSSRSIYELLVVFPRLHRDHRMDGSNSLRWMIGDASPRSFPDAASSFVRRLYERITTAFRAIGRR